ncbi:hypothetical protein AB0271_09290 [Kocuria palustris]|uniref:hypothetical protein n=1 Tax=Kocuria palustris TaxID=71999 RepID=UPI00344EDD90
MSANLGTPSCPATAALKHLKAQLGTRLSTDPAELEPLRGTARDTAATAPLWR